MQFALAPISPPTLRTARLVLRPMTEADGPAYIAADRDSADFFAQYAPPLTGPIDHAAGFAQQLARTTTGLADGTAVRLAAFLHAGDLVGHFNLSDIVRSVSQRCNVGYRVYRPFVRQGFATEVMRAVLAYAFAPPPAGLELHRVECGIQPGNVPSLALAAKLGFKRYGYAERFLFLGNAWRDHILLAINSEDFPPPS